MGLIFEGCVARMGKKKMHRGFLVGKPERLFSLKTYEVDGKIN